MLCPVCKNIPLEDKELELGLKGYVCNQCRGCWVRYDDYERWRKSDMQSVSPIHNDPEFNLEYDNKKANFCPDCGRILIKYKVSGNLPFYVDHCETCNGLWLDRCEWESIVDNNLQDKVKDFFTQPWQEKIRKEMTAQRFEEVYQQKFGKADYEKLKEIREWICNSDKRDEIIAYLIDKDPYKL